MRRGQSGSILYSAPKSSAHFPNSLSCWTNVSASLSTNPLITTSSDKLGLTYRLTTRYVLVPRVRAIARSYGGSLENTIPCASKVNCLRAFCHDQYLVQGGCLHLYSDSRIVALTHCGVALWLSCFLSRRALGRVPTQMIYL